MKELEFITKILLIIIILFAVSLFDQGDELGEC